MSTVKISGLNSNLDTDSIVEALVSAYSLKKDNLVKAQTKLSWKMNAWSSLNTKIKSFFTSTLGNMRYASSYTKKKTTVGDSSVATVVTGDSAVDGTQTLAVKQLAKPGYLTGGVLSTKNSSKLSSSSSINSLLGSDSQLSDGETGSFNITVGSKTTSIDITGSSTISDVVSKLNSAGVSANYDSTNKRIFVNSLGSGEANDFSITGTDGNGVNALAGLGLLTDASTNSSYAAWSGMSTDSTDTDGYAAYQAAIVTAYNNKVSDLTSANSRLNDNITAWTDEKNTALNNVQTNQDLIDAADVATNYSSYNGTTATEKLEAVNDKLSALSTLKTQLEDDTLTDEDRAAIQAIIDTYDKEQLETDGEALATVAGYETLVGAYQSEADGYTTSITAAQTTYDENAAKLADTDTLNSEATAEVTANVEAAMAAASAGNSSDAVKTDGQDAKILLNGAEFTSSSNSFTVNGLTITANGESDSTTDATTGTTAYKETTLSTADDTDGIYDMIKSFLSGYNKLIKEMDTLYNADSASKYDPLTSDEKESMSDSEVELWETKIKDALLRQDDDLGTAVSTLKNNMLKSFTVNGTSYNLSSFGIETLGYFSSDENEKGVYHIDGDSDDSDTSTDKDKLKAAIASNPDSVTSFFTQLSTNLYTELNDKMRTSATRSIYHMYDDKSLDDEYDDYTDKISKQESKIATLEDHWYSKFTAMEKALSKINSSSSAITSLLGS